MEADRPSPSRRGTRPGRSVSADLGGGVSCLVPLALYGDDAGTLPHAKTDPAKPALSRYSGDDRTTRLADVALGWNILQHFYPYFDVVTTDWSAVLRAALTSAAQDPNAARVPGDAPADGRRLERRPWRGLLTPGGDPTGSPPLAWDWIEGQVVVTRVGDRVKDAKPGDIIRTIDGKPAAEALADVERSISGATPQWRRYIGLKRLGAGAPGSEVVLGLGDAGQPPRTVRLSRERWPEDRDRRSSRRSARGFIMWMSSRIDDEDFRRALPDLERAEGIVFDFRGYPSKLNPFTFFAHLNEKPMTSRSGMSRTSGGPIASG